MWRHPFLKGLSVLVVLNVLVKPLWVLGIDRAVQNQLGHEVYGEYFALMNLSVALSFIADAGLTNMMNREMATGETLNVGRILWLKIILSISYLSIVFLTALLAGCSNWSVLFYVCGIQILASFLLFFRAVITANQQFQTDAWLSVFDKSLLIVVCSIFLYGPTNINLDLDLFLQLQLASLATALALAGFFALKKISSGENSFFSFGLLRRSLPFFVLILLMSFHNRIDAFLLERIHPNGAYEAGIYASAYRLLDAANMVGYLVASFLVPFAARHLGDKPRLGKVSYALRNALLALAVLLLPLVFVYGKTMLHWLYPSLTAYPVRILQICLAALPFYYCTHIYGSMLTAAGALKTFTWIVGLSLVVNISLNFILVPFGAIGCTIAAFFSQLIVAALSMRSVKKSLGVSIHFSSLLGHVLAGLVVWLFLYFGNKWGYGIFTVVASGFFVIAFLMFVTLRQLRTAFNT